MVVGAHILSAHIMQCKFVYVQIARRCEEM